MAQHFYGKSLVRRKSKRTLKMRQTITLLKVRFDHFVESLTSTAIGKSLKLPMACFPYEIRLIAQSDRRIYLWRFSIMFWRSNPAHF